MVLFLSRISLVVFFFCIHIQYDFSVCYFMSYPVGFFCVCSIFALA